MAKGWERSENEKVKNQFWGAVAVWVAPVYSPGDGQGHQDATDGYMVFRRTGLGPQDGKALPV